MPESRTRVETYQVDYVCDSCGKGKMKPVGHVEMAVEMTSPPRWPHYCEACNAHKTFRNVYPMTVHQVVTLPEPTSPPSPPTPDPADPTDPEDIGVEYE